MYLPEAIRAPANRPGGIAALGFGSLALVFGALAFGTIGAAVVVFAALVLLVVEVVRDAARLHTDLAATQEELRQARSDREIDQLQLRETTERAVAAEDLEQKNAELVAHIADLQQRVADPNFTFQQTLDAVTRQQAFVAAVREHRARASTSESQWPVVQMRMAEAGWVSVKAVVSENSDARIEDEVALVHVPSEMVHGFGNISSVVDRELLAVFDPDDLNADLQQELQAVGALAPNGFAIRLAGLTVDLFGSPTDADLAAIEAALQRAADAMAGGLLGSPQLDLENELTEGHE